jgi:hypothetical protein
VQPKIRGGMKNMGFSEPFSKITEGLWRALTKMLVSSILKMKAASFSCVRNF